MAHKRKRSLDQSLVLHDESIRHPFRASLPADILHISVEEVVTETELKAKSFLTNEDMHLFFLSFAAFFTAFYLFIV